MSRRRLTPEERELWERVAASARRSGRVRSTGADDAVPAPKGPDAQAPQPQLAPFRIGERAAVPMQRDLRTSTREILSAQPVAMDRKAHRAMTRGRLDPEARLDLHGMTLAEAHPELTAFVLGAQAGGRRLILIITGKGRQRGDGGPIPRAAGLLRHQVPQWLALPPLAQAVLHVGVAHARHGGEGAYYVYLRRAR